MPIILTGTTGNLGSGVLKHLLTLVPPSELIVSVHNPNAKHDELIKKGVQVRSSDYTKPETLEAAYKGGDKLFLVSSPSFDDELRVAQHTNAINAAKKVGVKHVYYTSLAFMNPTSPDTSVSVVAQAHLRTEAILKASGLTYTIIREGVYLESYPVFLGFWSTKDKEVVLPSDGGVSWIQREDLAEANARLLLSTKYDNKTVLLSGPRSYSLKETTEIVSKALGREIGFRTIGVDAWSKALEHVPAAKFWASSYPAMEQGEAAQTSTVAEELLGRPIKSIEQELTKLVQAADKSGSDEFSNWTKGGEGKRN